MIEEKRELIETVATSLFMGLMMIGTLIYAVVQREYFLLIALFAATYVVFTSIKSTVAYYKERFEEIKKEKEKHKVA